MTSPSRRASPCHLPSVLSPTPFPCGAWSVEPAEHSLGGRRRRPRSSERCPIRRRRTGLPAHGDAGQRPPAPAAGRAPQSGIIRCIRGHRAATYGGAKSSPIVLRRPTEASVEVGAISPHRGDFSRGRGPHPGYLTRADGPGRRDTPLNRGMSLAPRPLQEIIAGANRGIPLALDAHQACNGGISLAITGWPSRSPGVCDSRPYGGMRLAPTGGNNSREPSRFSCIRSCSDTCRIS